MSTKETYIKWICEYISKLGDKDIVILSQIYTVLKKYVEEHANN